MNKIFRGNFNLFEEDQILPNPLVVAVGTGGIDRIFRCHYLFFDEDQTPYTLGEVARQILGSGKNQQQMRQDFIEMQNEEALILLGL